MFILNKAFLQAKHGWITESIGHLIDFFCHLEKKNTKNKTDKWYEFEILIRRTSFIKSTNRNKYIFLIFYRFYSKSSFKLIFYYIFFYPKIKECQSVQKDHFCNQSLLNLHTKRCKYFWLRRLFIWINKFIPFNSSNPKKKNIYVQDDLRNR